MSKRKAKSQSDQPEQAIKDSLDNLKGIGVSSIGISGPGLEAQE